MIKSIHDGGPAFPWLPPVSNPNAYAQFPSGIGMTLRDWFAGKALAGLLANPEATREFGPKDWAGCAYEQADAMIAVRGESK